MTASKSTNPSATPQPAWDAALRQTLQPTSLGAACPVITSADVMRIASQPTPAHVARTMIALERAGDVVQIQKSDDTLYGLVRWPKGSRSRTGWVSAAALEAVRGRLFDRASAARAFSADGNEKSRALRKRAEAIVLARRVSEVDAEYERLLAMAAW